MQIFSLPRPLASEQDQRLLVDPIGRIIQYDLKPNEVMNDDRKIVPVYFIVLKGTAIFQLANGATQECAPLMLIVAEAKDEHDFRAGPNGATVLAFYHWAVGG